MMFLSRYRSPGLQLGSFFLHFGIDSAGRAGDTRFRLTTPGHQISGGSTLFLSGILYPVYKLINCTYCPDL